MFVPNGNRVLVTLDDVGDKTEGGLYVPQSATGEGPRKGTVESVSASYLVNGIPVASPFKKGDRVLVDTLGATKVRVEGVDYVAVRNEDIIGRFE